MIYCHIKRFNEKRFREAHKNSKNVLHVLVAEYRWLLGKVKRQVKVQEEQRSALVRLPTPESALSMPVYQKVSSQPQVLLVI